MSEVKRKEGNEGKEGFDGGSGSLSFSSGQIRSLRIKVHGCGKKKESDEMRGKFEENGNPLAVLSPSGRNNLPRILRVEKINDMLIVKGEASTSEFQSKGKLDGEREMRKVTYIGSGQVDSRRENRVKDDHWLFRPDAEAAAQFAVGYVTQGDKSGTLEYTLHVRPMKTLRPIRLEPRVEGIPYDVHDMRYQKDGSEGTYDNDNTNAQTSHYNLIHAFGSKQVRNKLENSSRRKVDGRSINTATAQMVYDATAAAASSHSLSNAQNSQLLLLCQTIPPHNLEATNAQEAYPLEKIVPKGLWASIDDEANVLLKFCEESSLANSQAAVEAINNCNSNTENKSEEIKNKNIYQKNAVKLKTLKVQSRVPKLVRLIGVECVSQIRESIEVGPQEKDGVSLSVCRALILCSQMISFAGSINHNHRGTLRVTNTDEPVKTLAARLQIASIPAMSFLLTRFAERVVDQGAVDVYDGDDSNANPSGNANVYDWHVTPTQIDQLLQHILVILLVCTSYPGSIGLNMIHVTQSLMVRKTEDLILLAKTVGADVVLRRNKDDDSRSNSSKINKFTKGAIATLLRKGTEENDGDHAVTLREKLCAALPRNRPRKKKREE